MWRPAQVRNERGEWTWNRVLRETTRGRWGTYAVRDSSTHEVLYVGESSVDSSKRPALRWWKTITRHWQDPTGKFAARKEVTFTAKHPWKYEIALWPASSPEAALRKQADLIARLKPTRNKDDGRAKDEGEGNEEMGAFNFGANVRSNPGTSTERPTARDVWAAIQGAVFFAANPKLASEGGVWYVLNAGRRVFAADGAEFAPWLRWALKVADHRRSSIAHETEPTAAWLRAFPPLRDASGVLDAVTRGAWWPYAVSGSKPRTEPREWGEFPVSMYIGQSYRPAEGADRELVDFFAATLCVAALAEAMARVRTSGAAARAFDAAALGTRQRWAYGELVSLLPAAAESAEPEVEAKPKPGAGRTFRATPKRVAFLRLIADYEGARAAGQPTDLDASVVGRDDLDAFRAAGLLDVDPSTRRWSLTSEGWSWLRRADESGLRHGWPRGVWVWDAREARPVVREAAGQGPVAQRPEGYGEASEHKGAAPGQIKLFNPRLRLPPALQREVDLFAGVPAKAPAPAPVPAPASRKRTSKRERESAGEAWLAAIEAAQTNARAMLRASRAPDHAAYWRGYLAVVNGRLPLPTYHGDFADQYAAGARDAARVLSTAGAPYSDAMGEEVRELGDRVERQRRAPRQPNPQASKAEREKAAAEYEDTHWGAPAKGAARALDVVDVTHGRLIELGTLARVDYETTKKGDPKNAIYWHEFEHVRPTLAYHACDRSGCPDRGKLVIAGGSYRVQRHGIVG